MKILSVSSVQRIGLVACLVLGMFVVGHLQGTRSANLSNVSVTLSSSRPSFRGGLASGNTVGSSEVILNTTNGVWPSSSSAQLMVGDSLKIGEAGSLGTYTITEIVDNSTVNVTPVLIAGDTELNDDVVASTSATLTVRLTTANAIANGAFRILVPADTTDAAARDGIPDGTGFDFGTSAPTVTCPSSAPAQYLFATGTATASAVTVNGTKYHSFECRYFGTGAIGTAFDGTTYSAITISSLINPAPNQSGHIIGYADTYNIIVRQVDSTYAVADATTVNVGVVESVRVTATVGPQITFRILGVNSGTSVCGVNTDVSTTASLVPLGSLNISAFTNAAQALSVSTNAPNGYAVTTVENDQLGRNGGVCTGDNTGVNCIPDSVGDGSAMSHTAPAKWSLGTVKGFAYSLHEVNTTGALPDFTYQTNSGNCDGTDYCFKQFADAEDGQSSQRIFSSTTVADNDNVFVCYKAIIAATQAAGEYSNYLTYTATATF
jgi:hypothetical protein